jgi:hypothetical protein
MVDMFTAELDDRIVPGEVFHAKRTRLVESNGFYIIEYNR